MNFSSRLFCAPRLVAVAFGMAMLWLAAAPAGAAPAEAVLAITALGVDPTSGDHDQWINLLSTSYQVSQSLAGNRRVSPPTFGNVVVIKEVDASSPRFLEAMSAGTTFDEAQIDFVGEGGITYAKLKLNGVVISSYAFTGSHSIGEVPREQVSLRYERFSLETTDRNQTATQEFFFDQFTGETGFSASTPGKAPPVLHLPGIQIGLAGGSLTFPVGVSDADTPIGELTLSVASSNPVLLPEGAIDVSGNGDQRQVKIALDAMGTGQVELTFSVSDGSNSSSQSLLVIINPEIAGGYQFAVSPNTIAEHRPAGTLVGLLEATPALPGPFELVDGAAGLFRLENGGVVVNDPMNLDFERKPRPSIVVRTTIPGEAIQIYGVVGIEVEDVPEGFFDEWRGRFFTPEEQLIPEISGPNADPDNDLLTNSAECALDLPPRDGNVPPHAPRLERVAIGDQTFLTIRYRRRPAAVDPDVAVFPEHSNDGKTWDRRDFTLAVTPSENEAGEAIEEVSARYDLPVGSGVRLLVRLRIQR